MTIHNRNSPDPSGQNFPYLDLWPLSHYLTVKSDLDPLNTKGAGGFGEKIFQI